MKEINVLDFVSKESIRQKVASLGNETLKKSSHLYQEFGAIAIGKAAKKMAVEYSDKSKDRPAIKLIEVVLSANRNYTKVVQPHINRIRDEHSEINSFDELYNFLNSKSKQEFFKFWGHKDDKKFNTLTSILEKYLY